ncbi:MAG: aspartate aminotransferase family protein [Dorea sp.]|jgi:acetylornithine/N-succinyldiaminopimelate aminotransferase|nr:aspartate aminotransferase family protein [Dorea sp.]
MNSMDIQKKDSKYIANTYKRFPVALVEGKGAVAKDPEGKEYIDFTSGIGVNSLGYADAGWADAVAAQARRLQHVSNLYSTQPDVEVAERLCEYTGFSKVFFGNSGAEANEGALKVARKYGMEKHGARCNTVITLRNSFHGRTITTLSATGQDSFHQFFFPFTEGFRFVEAGDIEGLRDAVDETVCGIMIELIQGEGGVVPVDAEFVREVARICEEKDLVFAVDEVQTGIGRTGTFLCYEQFGVKPDVVSMAKGIGGGLPLGAVMMNEKTADVLGFGQHGSTFGGNPVACAGAAYVLDRVMKPEFLEEIRNKSEYMKKKLLEIPQIKSVTGLGLMLGAELEEGLTAGETAGKCVEEGLLVLTAKTKLRFLPPLVINYEEIDKGMEILARVLQG